MIFRKEPLLDAEWLLGPVEPQPRSFIRKDACAVILVTTVAAVVGWIQLSNHVLVANQSKQPAADDSNVNSYMSLPEQASLRTPEFSKIDESMIRIVDRFVPHAPTDTAGNTSLPHTTIKNASAAIVLPQINLNTAIESHFAVADLRMDANPVVPLDLLAVRTLESGDELSLQRSADKFSMDEEDAVQLGGALLQSNKPTRVIRAVSYTGNSSQDDQVGISPGEPARLNRNVLRLSAAASVDEGSVEFDSAIGNQGQISGLENRQTGEVVRLLGSIQPRLAGAALNELKRRGFSEMHLQLAVDLASGRRETRIAAMERLITEPNISPLQWLVWMAEDEDRKIREHSIRLMSTMPGEDVRMEMRLLMNREKDAGLLDLLRKASFSSGEVSTKYEKKR